MVSDSPTGGMPGLARRRGYVLAVGLLVVMMLGGTLPIPLHVLYEKQMGLGPLGVTGRLRRLRAIGPVDASVYISALVAVVVLAFFVVLRAFEAVPAPRPPCTPSDSRCSPEQAVTADSTSR